MEETINWVTVVVNHLLGRPATALLAALHIQPSNPAYPIPTHVSMEFFVFLIAAIFFIWLKQRISVDRPGATQQCMEMILTNSMGVGIQDLIDDNIGHDGEKYLPLLGSIGIFILFCNLISVVPTLVSPTATISVPLGCAIIVFVYYNWTGLVKHGPLGYGKRFFGPKMPMPPPMNWVIAGIMFVIETFSHAARLLSLTVRLWANMFASELLYALFLGLLLDLFLFAGKLNAAGNITAILPLGIPVLFVALHIFVAVLQAFVFTVLPIVYVGGAVGEEH
ncbi:MAG: F0F1 ATP synthase subunit A [Candidatus Acidiferrales bacterium]